jgi:hypothetical protein
VEVVVLSVVAIVFNVLGDVVLISPVVVLISLKSGGSKTEITIYH